VNLDWISRKKVIQWSIAIGVVLLTIVFRTWYEARSEYVKGQSFEEQRKWHEAIHHYDRSAHWYSPGNIYVGRSLDRLWGIGKKLEEEDRGSSLLAYDAMRGSIFAIRSFYWPYQNRLESINGRIAFLRAHQDHENRPGRTFEEVHQFHKKALILQERPSTLWSLVVTLFFFGWVGSVVAWIFKGFDGEGRMHIKASLPWAASIILCFAVWVFGLVNA